MGLEDVGDGIEEPSSSSKEYTQITTGDFEEFLDYDVGCDWSYVEPSRELDMMRSHELVYSIDLPEDDLELRIFSTINKATNKSRGKGEDAIRTVIWSDDYNRPIAGRRKTLRISTWRKNLKKKIDELMSEWDDLVTRCGECGGYLVKRESQYGEFLGCINYPECKNKENL